MTDINQQRRTGSGLFKSSIPVLPGGTEENREEDIPTRYWKSGNSQFTECET